MRKFKQKSIKIMKEIISSAKDVYSEDKSIIIGCLVGWIIGSLLFFLIMG